MKEFPRVTASVVAFALILFCFSAVAMADTETETATQTSSSLTSSQGQLRFSMVPSPLSGATGYRQGNGSADLEIQGTYVAVHFEAAGMASSVHLALVVLVNGTSHPVANMTTSYEGEVEAEAAISLAPGSYSLGLQVLDASTFSSPTVVLVSSPATQSVTVAQGTQVTYTATGESTQPVSTLQGGESEDTGIRTAIQTKFIPAVVDVGESGSSIHVNDGNFSVSVGRYQQDGYLVSISAVNVAGPRVLLVNLTSSQARSLFSSPVVITLDGTPVPQATTLSEVLGAKSGDPARFIVVSTPSALTLLVSIPHFSYHTISIIPIIAQAGAALAVDLPSLLFAVAAVSVVVLAVYSRRTRFAP